MGNKWKNAQRDKRAPYGWQGGFTLIEVLCALALAGLLLSIGMTHYQQHSEAVKQERHQANIALIEGAARRFRLDTGLFPSAIRDLTVAPSETADWVGPYLTQIPINPWDAHQEYRLNRLGRVEE